jgi:hypothetical protein
LASRVDRGRGGGSGDAGAGAAGEDQDGGHIYSINRCE